MYKRNTEFIFFVIGVVLMAVVLALVLFKGEKIKEQKAVIRLNEYYTSEGRRHGR